MTDEQIDTAAVPPLKKTFVCKDHQKALKAQKRWNWSERNVKEEENRNWIGSHCALEVI